MSLVHVYVPGLVRGHVEGPRRWGPPGARPPDRRADLVLTFPATVANVQRTMLTGRSAHRRGAVAHELVTQGEFESGLGPKILVRRLDDAMPVDGCVHVPVLDLFSTLQLSGAGSDGEWTVLDLIAAGLGRILDSGHGLLVTGGPPLQRAIRQIEVPSFLAEDTRSGGALAFVSRELSAGERDACLRTNGIERVLQGEALESWGAPAEGAILTAEPGWSFEPGERTSGHREIAEPGDTPVVLAWGGTGAPWPSAVHDHRIGPTLAAAADLARDGADDDPLPW